MNRAGFNGASLNGTRLSVVVLATAALVATATVVTSPTRRTAATASGTARAILAPTAVRELRSSPAFVGASSCVVYAAQQSVALSAAMVGRATLLPLVYNYVPATGAFVGKATFEAFPAAKFATASYTGVGTLSATATRRTSGTTSGTATAVLAAAPISNRLPTAAIVGRAVLRGEPMINNRHFPYAYPVGVATLSFDNLKITNAADSIFVEGFGYLDPTPTHRQAASAPMAGAATMDVAPVREARPTAAIVCTATLLPDGVREVRPTAAPVGVALINAVARRTQQATVSFDAPATMTAEVTRQQQATVSMPTVVLMVADATVYRLPTAGLVARATLAVRGVVNPGAGETAGQEFYRAATVREFVRPLTVREWESAMGLVGTASKQPAEIEDYTIDYSEDLSRSDEVTTIVSVTADPAGLTVQDSLILPGGKKVTFTVVGGDNGVTYKVTALVDTTEGRRLEDEVKIKVKEV